MTCWRCQECGMRNCGTTECINPNCPSYKRKILAILKEEEIADTRTED